MKEIRSLQSFHSSNGWLKWLGHSFQVDEAMGFLPEICDLNLSVFNDRNNLELNRDVVPAANKSKCLGLMVILKLHY
jgi:hypothetical protein